MRKEGRVLRSYNENKRTSLSLWTAKAGGVCMCVAGGVLGLPFALGLENRKSHRQQAHLTGPKDCIAWDYFFHGAQTGCGQCAGVNEPGMRSTFRELK